MSECKHEFWKHPLYDRNKIVFCKKCPDVFYDCGGTLTETKDLRQKVQELRGKYKDAPPFVSEPDEIFSQTMDRVIELVENIDEDTSLMWREKLLECLKEMKKEGRK